MIVPTVTLPPAAPPRTDYWLSRDELAARIRAARRSRRTHHVARVLLIGYYSATRPGAILALGWLPSATHGWIDLGKGVLHRRGSSSRITNKRKPPARIHRRLLSHLRRWHRLDIGRDVSITHVINYQGEAVAKLRRSWSSVADRAVAMTKEASRRKRTTLPAWAATRRSDGPHILRHSCCTWLMADGVDVYEVSGYTGVSVKVLLEVYGHHHPEFQSNAATATGKRSRRP